MFQLGLHSLFGKCFPDRMGFQLNKWLPPGKCLKSRKHFFKTHFSQPEKHRKMSIQWVPGCGSRVPSNAVPGGVDRGTRLYVARALHAGSLVPGKLHPANKNVYVRSGTIVTSSSFQADNLFVSSYGGNEHAKGSGYEILTGEGFQWKAAENGRVPQGAMKRRSWCVCPRPVKTTLFHFFIKYIS